MTGESIHTWDRWAGGAADRLIMICAPLLLAGWLVLASWCVVALSGLAALSAPPLTVAAHTTGQGAGPIVVWIGPTQRPLPDRR